MPPTNPPPPSTYRRDAEDGPQSPAQAEAARIERVDTLTRTARTSWFGLVSYLAFVGVTLLGVDDADFFIPERQTQLPLVGVSIPTLLFFATAPALGAALYAYFHLHLLKLWDALGDALPPAPVPPRRGLRSHLPPLRGHEPAGPDDRPLGDRIAPWLVNDLALSYRADALTHRPLRWIALLATGVLSFLAGPLVLFFFWLWSMPAHNELLTVVGCGVPLFVSIITGISSWRQMRHRVMGLPALTPLTKRLRDAAAWSGFAVVTIVGWLTTEGSFAYHARTWLGFEEFRNDNDEWVDPTDGRWWADDRLNAFLVRADLENVNFVDAPHEFRTHDVDKAAFRREWCAAEGIPPAACDLPEGADATAKGHMALRRLAWCREEQGLDPDPRGARCRARFDRLEDDYARAWNLRRNSDRAALTARNYTGKDLRGANLRGARLEGADLLAARLEGANLWRARLDATTDFRPASLRGAGLRDVDLGEATTNDAFHDAFGDASVGLPAGLEAGKGPLAHWATEELGFFEFVNRWREWQAGIGLAPPGN